MPRLLIFIRYERRFPILISIFNHYFIWQSKHNDDRLYLGPISEHLLQVPSFSPSPSSRFTGKKKSWDWVSLKDFARQEHRAHQSVCSPTRKVQWMEGCNLWPLKKGVSLHSKVWTLLAQIISMKELFSLCFLTFWFWQQVERGMEKLSTFITLLISPQSWVNRQAAMHERRVFLSGDGWWLIFWLLSLV